MRCIRTLILELFRQRRGSVALIFGLASPAIIGTAALGVEVGIWYLDQARMQEVADSAAMAGARELAAGTGMVSAAVTRSGTLNNCTSGSGCSLGTPTTFTTSGSSTTNGVQVTASMTVTPLLAGLFVPTNANGSITIAATAKAAFTQSASGGSTGCVLGLDSGADYTVALNNNASINCNTVSNSKCQGKNSSTCTLDATTYGSYSCSSSIDPQCGAKLSSASTSSLFLSNNASIGANATAAGVIYLNNNASITGTKLANSTQVADPYRSLSLSVPTATGSPVIAGGNGSTSATAIDISIAANTCSTAALTYANNLYLHIHPGCYNGWNLQNNVTVTLYPGTYYIKSQFTVGNNAVVTGTGGTALIFAGSGSSSYAINITNNASLTLVAPSTGSFAGIALMGDPAGTATLVQSFSNNASLNIKGAIYFRNQIIDFENNAASGGSCGCTQVIGRRVLLSNNATLGLNCTGVGVTPIEIGQQVTTIVDLVQ